MNDLRCPACNHNVVSWCPDDSQFDGDLVCYNCGLHKISTAWKKIEYLQARVAELKAVIANAPHSGGCNVWRDFPCDCWKKKVSDE
jgi:transcription elongation factor Elf1